MLLSRKWYQESIRQCYCTICFIFIGLFFNSFFLPFSFRMHNTGKIALEYSWEEAADSEPVQKPYSTTLMRKGISLGS